MSLRAPICTILGNVNVGKTLLLDILRSSHVLGDEAGGITQKIGVTSFTKERLIELTSSINKEIIIPGIMFIDTPGHDCFSNQRICGVEISDLVIVVVDIVKGIEKQTIECFKLLKKTKTPFIIALNKLDRIDGWVPTKNTISLKQSFAEQEKLVLKSLEEYINKIIVQVAENGMNAAVYYKNNNMKEFISMVPVSAKTGEGIPDLLILLNMLASKFLQKTLLVKTDEDYADGYIVETIKGEHHYGEVVSIIITNGTLKNNDTITTLSKYNEIVEIKIKNLLIPENNKEVKDKFNLNKTDKVVASQSLVLKLEDVNIRTGVRFFRTTTEKDKEKVKKLLEEDKGESDTIKDRIFKQQGVFINAQTSGMAEALYAMCETESIDVAGINIGPVDKVHLMKAETVISENIKDPDEIDFLKKYRVILAFAVPVTDWANKVKVIHDNVIYKLIDKYKAYVEELNDSIKKRHPNIVSICEMKILEKDIYRKKNPLIFGVNITKNKLLKGMQVEVHKGKDKLLLGEIAGIQKNKTSFDEAEQGDDVCLRIDCKFEYGRDFDHTYSMRTYLSEEDKRIGKKYAQIFYKK